MTTGAYGLEVDKIEWNGEVYDLLYERGRLQWDRRSEAGQLGDATQIKIAPIELHGGFGATRRHRRSDGKQADPAHHAYAENAMATRDGIVHASPRITYLDLSTLTRRRTGFRVGGYSNSVVGGTGISGGSTALGAVGGGTVTDTPWYIREFGSGLYVHAGPYTFTVNPDLATPTLVETRFHGVNARARKSDVFGNELVVALGAGQVMDIAESAYTPGSPVTLWEQAEVARDVVHTGIGGRFYNSLANKVYSVQPGNDPRLSANYFPSNGETITDVSEPVRALSEYLTALVAGTAASVRTLDPSRGYQGVAVLPISRLSASEFDGRALMALGPMLMHATVEAVYLSQYGQRPEQAGPELLHNNDTPYKDMEWGVPDFMGNYMAWPAYIPSTGDSVIFYARLRDAEDQGTGPVAWHDVLFLDGRECRCVRLWGGSSTIGPRLFFGAGTAANEFQIGWCDPRDVNVNEGKPAESGFIEWPLDDMGSPGVLKSVERIEIPEVDDADATNYAVIQMRTESVALTNLVKAQSGSNQERLNSEGWNAVYAQTATPLLGRQLGGRITFTQASGATTFVKLRGAMLLHYSEVPREVQIVNTVIDCKTDDTKAAEEFVDALRATAVLGHRRLRFGLDGKDRYARIVLGETKLMEVSGADGGKQTMRYGVPVSFREVPTA